MLKAFLEGFNSTIFAYGQTGCGKSYTIFGSMPSKKNPEELGIINYSIKEIFDQFKLDKSESEYRLSMNYYEIYNEEFRDLLKDSDTSLCSSPSSHRAFEKYSIYEDPVRGIQVSGNYFLH